MPPTDAVPLEDLVGLPECYHPDVSPDGSTVACYYDGTGRNEVHLIDVESGAREQLTDGEVPRNARWYARWDATGEWLLFHDDEAGDEQHDIYALSLDGAVERVVAPDGQAIIRDSTPSSLLYSADAGQQLNLYRHDVDTDESTQLTHYDQPVVGAWFGPAGERIAYEANESETLENQDVYVANADGTDARRYAVGEDGSETSLGRWFPDGERLLVADDADGMKQVGVLHLGTGDVDWLGPHEDEEAAIAVSPDGETVLAARDRRAATVPVVYDVATGSGRELDMPGEADGVYPYRLLPPGRVFADDSTVVLPYSTPDRRRRCYAYDLETDEARILLAPDDGDVDPASFVDASYVTYESEDGLEIGGLLFDPRDGPARADDATDLPAVVMVHGGPHYRASRRYNLYVQFLVSRGYAVLQPNYRGSTGRGRAFKEAIHGDWGGMEQVDVAEGGRWLMNRDWIDADRVAVFGGSYGGYSVYCQLTQYPRLWTTGIAWIGITDLHRLFEDDMPHFQHQLLTQMGDPEENHDLWRDRSPIEHVDAMERPICIIHGVNDPRCPVVQARIFRDALEDRGWEQGEDFEYTELGEEGHGSTDVEQKIRVFRLLDDYLERRV